MVATQSHTAPLVVVVGATGHQGGSVLRALQASPQPYRLRAITRDAQRLEQTDGIEVVELSVTLGNEQGVAAAFDNADIVFAVTQYFEHWDKAREVAEGKMMIDAAKRAGVKLFIWSTLPHVSKISNGAITEVEFMDSKAEIAEYGRVSAGRIFATVACAFYSTNITEIGYFNAFKKNENGIIDFTLNADESLRIPIIDVDEDYGKYVRAVIEDPQLGAGTQLETGVDVSVANVVEALRKATKKDIRYREISTEHFATVQLAAYGADKQWQVPRMFDHFRANGLFGDHGEGPSRRTSAEVLRKLHLTPRTFEQALEHTDLSGFDKL